MPQLRKNDNTTFEGDGLDTPLQYTNPEVPQPGPGAPPQAAPQAGAPPPSAAPAATNPSQWSRPMEDQWMNFANTQYGGKANGNLNDIVANYNKTYNTNANVVGNDKVDFGFGPTDVIKDVGGSNQLWMGDYADPNHVSPNSGGGGGGQAAPQQSYAAPQASGGGNGSNALPTFMGQQAPVADHQNFDSIMSSLKGLFPNGAYNQDIVNRQSENARENLLRQRKSTDANNRASLANRGILSEGTGHESGPEITALTRADQNMADQYSNAVSGIYANESNNASNRMMNALQTAAGLSSTDAQQLINAYMAQSERGLGSGALGNAAQRNSNDFTLGSGNLALGNVNAANNYNLGMANYGLGRDKLQLDQGNTEFDQILALLGLQQNGAAISAKGHI